MKPPHMHDVQETQGRLIFFRQRKGVGKRLQRSGREVGSEHDVLECRDVAGRSLDVRADGQHRTVRVAKDLLGSRTEQELLKAVLAASAQNDQVDRVRPDNVVDDIPGFPPAQDGFVGRDF